MLDDLKYKFDRIIVRSDSAGYSDKVMKKFNQTYSTNKNEAEYKFVIKMINKNQINYDGEVKTFKYKK